MDEKIQKKLEELNDYTKKTNEHNIGSFIQSGEPIKFVSEKELFEYGYWRIKEDIALNEFHALLAEKFTDRNLYSLEKLNKQKEELMSRLKEYKKWIEESKRNETT